MKRKDLKKISLLSPLSLSSLLFFCLCLSCGSKPTDIRTLVPAATLVYLETNDLATALQPIIDSKPFTEVAKSKPDFSALKGVQLAVAVTGFETSEEKLTDENSVGRVQPHFVAIADTHAWNYQAVKFAELKLGSFVESIYNSEPTLEKSDKNGGKYFVWTAKDGRKAYALVIDSLIYFGNDESAIDKCLAVRRGEADSIVKTGKVQPAAPDVLASGYVSTDGVAQIANIVSLKFASETSEDSEVQSAIAGILPQLLRNSITEISWTASQTEKGIEDKYVITTKPDIAQVFNETLAPGGEAESILFSHLTDVPSVTRYNLKDPQTAWRSVLLVLQKQADPITAKNINQLSGVLFEPYGIRNPEMFLSGVDSNILTAAIDDEPFVIATMGDEQKVKKSVDPDLKSDKVATDEGVTFWRTEGNEIGAAFDKNLVILGSVVGVGSGFRHGRFSATTPPKEILERLVRSKSSITTIATDLETVVLILNFLSPRERDDTKMNPTFYLTETRFTKAGMERKTTSDFGLIGSIIAQLAQN